MAFLARQNFHQECEAALNKQINLELYASYVYQSIAFYFDRDDVALSGFFDFFKKLSDEEREDAMKVQNLFNLCFWDHIMFSSCVLWLLSLYN